MTVVDGELMDELENEFKMHEIGKWKYFKTIVNVFSHILPVIRKFF